MKLSVTSFRAHSSAQKKILKYQNQLNYVTPHVSVVPNINSSSSTFNVGQMMVDSTGMRTDNIKPGTPITSETSSSKNTNDSSTANVKHSSTAVEKIVPSSRSNQRWMKLRTTVQLSSAISSTIKTSKPTLQREDSFIKRFSTRQVAEKQETLDTGDDGECSSGSQDNIEYMRRKRRLRRKQNKLPWSVVNPDENFYFNWLMVLTGCTLYNLWTAIVRQSLPELQHMASGWWSAMDAFSDIVFLLDVAVQFRTGYLEQGLMVYNTRKLAGHYIRSRSFLFDLIALTPLDLLQLKIGVHPILRFPRFIKVYRVYDYYYMVESRTVYPNFWRVINLIHILLILAHWFGCFYYLLSEAEGFKGDWVYPYKPGDYATLTRKYLGSLYWSTLTLTTIGDLPTPETNAEYVFTIVSYLIGVFIFATIVGQVGNVITNRNANRLEFERLLDGAKLYMRHHKVPSGMKKRVLRWYDYSWSRGRIQGGGDINTALGLLPDKLKTELALHVNLAVLKKVTIFQECQPEFLHDLVLKMKAYIFTPGDLICRKGEVAREMFIIADGILEVISSETGHVLTIMKAGDFFGEIGILNLDGFNKRTADVRSVGYSELFSLSREDVLAAMKDYPEAQDILQTLGKKRLMEARNANKAVADRIKSRAEAAENCSGIVEKIRSDVKGLRNAFSKGRRGTRTVVEESMELQPLTSSGRKSENTSSKSILRRMPRVWSDELASGTDHSDEDPRPLSPGIPILNKAKSEKEPRAGEFKKCLLSPPPTTASETRKESMNQEVIGAGLPLLQRLLILKQKNDQETVMENRSKKIEPEITTLKVKSNVKLKTPKKENPKAVSLKQRLSDVHTRPRKPTTNTKLWTLLKKATVLTPKSKLQDLRLNSEVPCQSSSLQSNIKPSTEFTNTNIGSSESKFIAMCQKLDDQYKQGSLIAQNISAHNNLTNKCTENNIIKEQCDIRLMQRPKVLHLDGKNRRYDSINDLSPEYSGLSFVKKLKILNERQKLAELEAKAFLRSASLDSAGCKNVDDSYCNQLTRSHSEAVALEVVLRNQKLRKPEPSSITPDESNETAERLRLKNILKKLSSNCFGNERVNQLMTSQTIEGYAARHSKLTRNVTFNPHKTIESSPDSCSSLFGIQDSISSQCKNSNLIPLDLSFKTDLQKSSQTTSNAKLSKRLSTDTIQYTPKRPDVKENCCNEILNGVKTIVEKCLNDIEGKYRDKIDELESEINKRDYTISTLCEQFNQKLSDEPIDERKLGALLDNYSKNIEEYEDNPFIRNDSVDTVMYPKISSFNSLSPFAIEDLGCYNSSSHSPALLSNKSWEDRSAEENMELRDLPKSIIPEPSWYHGETRIDMNCTDDEEEEFPPRWENWEAEMLVGHTNHTDLNMDSRLLSQRSLDEKSMIVHKGLQGRRRCLSIDNVPFSNSILRNFGQYVRLGSSSQTPSPDILPTISKSCFSLISQPEK
ncbi:uncharacterized protein LOC112690326 isoform X4 [Sipha flava]|uniref:Uncharacterized protein LOC112690326 isoform X4 n=1 Tax=Sipha flava TaxID=143950 RepID=A0A8B8GBH5_9HEMI|nr:uncharacterized protein LOC112690326 isoform X4 [Sipha flava]